MFKKIIFLVFLCFAHFATADEIYKSPPHSKAEYCQFSHDPRYFIDLAYEQTNHLAVSNRGGLLNGGVCWWHSLFQRSALYLSVFRPNLPKPTKSRASFIINSLARRNQVVEIPGYRNLFDFSQDWWPEIQIKLEQWQRIDGYLFRWVDNVSRTQTTDPSTLLEMLEVLYSTVNYKHEISWVMLKLPGITAHAWLVIGMRRTTNGFELDVLDSLAPRIIKTVNYIKGTDSIFADSFGKVVPYLNRTSDFKKFTLARKEYCGQLPAAN